MADYTLKIECISAVCPASGESWGGVVDNDVMYDDIGIPFIPAKRIKGLLLENAIDVCQAMQKVAKVDKKKCWTPEKLFDLFGLDGNETSAPIIIDDAKIDEYKKKRPWLAWAQKNVYDLASPMQVLSLFTTIRAQTAIARDIVPDANQLFSQENDVENKKKKDADPAGVAKPHSLRVQRVLRSGLIFESDIHVNEEKIENGMNYESLLALTAAATKHIGLNRNRGMGAVCMSLLKDKKPIDVDAILEEEVSNV